MAPLPQTKEQEIKSNKISGHRLSHPTPGEEVCITGISGYFPDSDNVYQLKENLFNKVKIIKISHILYQFSQFIPISYLSS